MNVGVEANLVITFQMSVYSEYYDLFLVRRVRIVTRRTGGAITALPNCTCPFRIHVRGTYSVIVSPMEDGPILMLWVYMRPAIPMFGFLFTDSHFLRFATRLQFLGWPHLSGHRSVVSQWFFFQKREILFLIKAASARCTMTTLESWNGTKTKKVNDIYVSLKRRHFQQFSTPCLWRSGAELYHRQWVERAVKGGATSSTAVSSLMVSWGCLWGVSGMGGAWAASVELNESREMPLQARFPEEESCCCTWKRYRDSRRRSEPCHEMAAKRQSRCTRFGDGKERR